MKFNGKVIQACSEVLSRVNTNLFCMKHGTSLPVISIRAKKLQTTSFVRFKHSNTCRSQAVSAQPYKKISLHPADRQPHAVESTNRFVYSCKIHLLVLSLSVSISQTFSIAINDTRPDTPISTILCHRFQIHMAVCSPGKR